MQEMSAQMTRLQSQIQQLNQRLLPMKVHAGFKDLGANMALVCDHLREMEQHRLRLAEDPAFRDEGERLRAMERIENRLQVMNREMAEAHDALQALVVMPERPGSPPDAAEQMIRAQRQREVEQAMKRSGDRLQALDTWAKGDKVSAAAKDMTKDLLQLQNRLRQWNQTCDKISEDPAMEPDRDRLREVDRIRDRVQVMFREVEETSDALEAAATPPAA